MILLNLSIFIQNSIDFTPLPIIKDQFYFINKVIQSICHLLVLHSVLKKSIKKLDNKRHWIIIINSILLIVLIQDLLIIGY